MHVVYTHGCGLDVHKKTITACLLISGDGGKGSVNFQATNAIQEDLLSLKGSDDCECCHENSHPTQM